jgi:hypothetical protein
MPQPQTHTHHGRSKTLTISGEKKFSEPGKKQATKRASSLSGVQPLRGFKRSEKPQKKKTITQKHKICAEIRCREKAKEKGKIGEAQGFSEGSSASGHPTSLFQISPHPFHLGAGRPEKKVGSISTVKTSPDPRLRTL